MTTTANNTHLTPQHDTQPRVRLTQSPPKRDDCSVITLDGDPYTDVWNDILSGHLSTLAVIIDDIIDRGDSSFPSKPVLNEISEHEEPTGNEYVLANVLSSWSSHGTWKDHCRAANFIKSLGDNIYTEIEDVCKVAKLLSTDEPFVFKITDGFKNQRADQRRDICQLISALSVTSQVYITPETTLLERWVANKHTPHLPGSLRQQCNSDTNPESQKQRNVNQALDDLDVDGGRVELLRFVDDAADETRTLEQLKSEFDVADDTIHNRVHNLREYNLLSETVETETGKAVFITSTGRAFLTAVYESSGVQATIEEQLIGTGKSSNNMPCNPAGDTERDGWGRDRLPQLHELRDLSRHRYHAASATTEDTDIAVVDTNVEALSDRAAPGIHVDHDNRAVVVSAEYDNPFNYWVTTARALANPRIWNSFLTADKLNSPDGEKFMELFDEHKVVLRQLRCLGYTPDDITTIEEYREHIVEALEALLNDTKRMTKQDYPGDLTRTEFRREILADAHGLAGIMAHLLDLINVDIVREMRIPRFREFDAGKRDNLIKTIGYGASIQSVFSEATSYRQLFEHRAEKREQMIEVGVEGKDPFSDLIGSFVIVGDFKSQKSAFVERLQRGFAPKSPHNDAPEFNLRLDITHDISRSEYATTINRVLDDKEIVPTQQAVSTVAGLVNSPYEAAEALHWLEPNEDIREVDSREVRYAIAQLHTDDILRGVTSTKQDVVMALLETDEVLSKGDLAEAAGVSTRSLRNHLDELVTLGLVKECPHGYRFDLAFNTDEERTSDRYPLYVVGEHNPAVHKAASAIKTGLTHHFDEAISDDEFPTWGGRKACADLRCLHRPEVWLRDILPLLWGIECRDTYLDDEILGGVVGSSGVDVQVGPEMSQQRIQAFG